MKIIFKLWGLNPNYLKTCFTKYTWVAKDLSFYKGEFKNVADSYSISFLHQPISESSVTYANYNPRKL